LDRHGQMTARLNGALDGVLAGESWTLSQGFYYGAVAGGHRVIVAESEGAAIDLNHELDLIAIDKPGRADDDGRQHEPGQPAAPIDDIRACLDAIPNDYVDWLRWNALMLAVFAASGGSAEGYDAVLDWSKRSAGFDADETKRMWDH